MTMIAPFCSHWLRLRPKMYRKKSESRHPGCLSFQWSEMLMTKGVSGGLWSFQQKSRGFPNEDRPMLICMQMHSFAHTWTAISAALHSHLVGEDPPIQTTLPPTAASPCGKSTFNGWHLLSHDCARKSQSCFGDVLTHGLMNRTMNKMKRANCFCFF